MTHSFTRPEEGLTLFQRIVRSAALLLALVVFGHAPALAAPAAPQRIVAVGDLHGDFDAWQRIARAAGLVDPNGRWSGGTTTLVQLGDVTDRGSDSLRIIRSLQQLQTDAPRSGGRVVVLLGNHEAMNLVGDLRYVTAGEFASYADDRSSARRERVYMANRKQLEAAARSTNPNLKPSQVRDRWLATTPLGWVEHRSAWAPTGELGRWAAANPAVLRIGSSLFVHGGLSAEFAALGIDTINYRVAAAMRRADDTSKSVLFDPLGPLWYRGLVTRDPKLDPQGVAAATAAPRPTIEEELAGALNATGTKRMVIAHTPILSGISMTYGGRLIRVDTGNSRYYGGQLSYLEIIGDRVVPHAVPRSP